LVHASHTPLEQVGLVASLGVMMGGFGINVGHELMHRARPSDRALAEILMASVSYPHFIVEHVLGHHKNVATPEDPATARLGESLYHFLPRTLVGGVQSAWRLEKKRVATHGLMRFGLRDRRLRYPLDVLLACAIIATFAGWIGVAYFAAESVIAILLLETINYVQHYGLARAEVSPGRYERVRDVHSWNSAVRVSNWYLFNLPRHSDHHSVASRPYPVLRHNGDSPQLPAGYGTMLLAAFVPPLWRRWMDARATEWRNRAALA
jgi:alkane 1-monooxygenase